MDSAGSRGEIEGVTIDNLKVRSLDEMERNEQLEQLRRAWWIKLLLRRRRR